VKLANLQRRLLGNAVVKDSELLVALPFEFLKGILVESDLLRSEFKEDWYLKVYPDVASQVKAGTFKNGLDHFIRQGFWSGRLGRPMAVDEAWYASFYDDVGRALANKELSDANQHFETHGFVEGRAAAASFRVEPSWYRQEYPEACLEVQIGKYATLQHHFNYEGFARGYHANSGSRGRR
jgi:hypothetical protein